MSEQNERDEKLLDDLADHEKLYYDVVGVSIERDYDAQFKVVAAYRAEIETAQSDEDWSVCNANMREATDKLKARVAELEAEVERFKARDAETVAALERAGFAHPGLSPAENIDEMDAEVERLRRNEQLIYFADGSSRMVEGPEAAIEYRVLCAKEIERLKFESRCSRATVASVRAWTNEWKAKADGLVAALELIEQGLSDRIMQRDDLKARVAELEAQIGMLRIDADKDAERFEVARNALEFEVERLRDANEKIALAAENRIGALEGERDEWRVQSEANRGSYQGCLRSLAEANGRAEANAAELDRAWKQVAVTHDLLAAAWAAADPDVIADYAREGIEAELDETRCPDYCAIYDKARDAQHALEVIEREKLDVCELLKGGWVLIAKDYGTDEQDSRGPTIIEAVKAYEQRKAKGGE